MQPTEPPFPPLCEKPHPYGHCPLCGAVGESRERRPDGNDRCAAGHTYPSVTAVPCKMARDEDEGEAAT